MKLAGVYVAIVTPFENGNIDEKTFESLLERLIKAGVTGVVICGSTGESSMLNTEKHIYMFELAKQIVRGRIQIVASAGSNSTEEAVFLAQKAEQIGADAILSVVPYYVKPTQEGIYQHFKAIHDATLSVPLIIYNVPSRTISDISVDTVVRLSQLERFAGIKEASGDIEKISNLIAQTQPGFAVLSGNDPTFLPLLSLGGDGVISVIGNIMPEELVKLYDEYINGHADKALEINKRMLPLYQALALEANPIPVKYALFRMGLIRNELKLPLTPLQERNQETMEQVLEKLDLI